MSDLMPCPFCGAGTFEIRPNGRMWLGMKYSEPASVSVLHWCEATPGQPSRVIERVGRDEASAIEAWNRRAQPAQAGQVLTDAEIAAEIRSRGQMVNGVKGDGFMQGARWAEQAVLKKRVPMTPEETDAAMKLLFYPARNRAFVDGVEAAERHHGIVGEKGGQ